MHYAHRQSNTNLNNCPCCREGLVSASSATWIVHRYGLAAFAPSTAVSERPGRSFLAPLRAIGRLLNQSQQTPCTINYAWSLSGKMDSFNYKRQAGLK